MPIIDPEALRSFLSSHPGWTMDGNAITRTFRFPGFVEAMGFVTSVALLSERADHHPDIDVRWNAVRIALTTHDQGGLTERDTALAAAIDGLGGYRRDPPGGSP